MNRVPLHNGERWLISGGREIRFQGFVLSVYEMKHVSAARLRTGSDRFIQTRTNRGHCRKLGWICWPARCPRFPKFNFVRLLCIFITDSNNTWPRMRIENRLVDPVCFSTILLQDTHCVAICVAKMDGRNKAREITNFSIFFQPPLRNFS